VLGSELGENSVIGHWESDCLLWIIKCSGIARVVSYWWNWILEWLPLLNLIIYWKWIVLFV